MKSNSRFLSFVVLVSAWAALPAKATTLVRLSLQQLTQVATDIVCGRVVGQESRWNSTHTQIITLTTMALHRVIKGHPPATLVIEQPGGAVGRLHTRVAATVHFYPNADYLLFVEPASTDPSRYLLVGMVQGAYRLDRDAQTQEERVIRPLGGLFYGPREPGGGAESSAQTVSLRAFQQRLSGLLRAPLAISKNTSIPVTIRATEFRGVARLRVLGQTAADIYPDTSLVIPAGSPVEGTAELVAGKWRIRWTQVLIRGAPIRISASSEEPSGESLRGRTVIIKVR